MSEPIAIDPVVSVNISGNFSPDSTRLLITMADRSAVLVLDTTGHILGRLPIAAVAPYISFNWSPDSTMFLLADAHLQTQLLLQTYTRDGQLFSATTNPPTFGRLYLENAIHAWSRCDPSLKIPHIDLPQ